jgi:tetratricopeptide (TPR) repeat protein
MTRGERILRAFAPGADPDLAAYELPPQDRARIIYDWGLYAGALGDLQLARRCYETQIGIACAIPSWEGVAMGLRTLAYTERLSGASAAALALVDSSLQAAARAESVLDLGSALSLRGRILHDLGRTEDAANDFARARAYAGEPFARRSLWEAEHLLDLGEVARVVAQTECNLEGMPELGWKGHAAQAHVLLGHAALRRIPADLRSARAHLSAARPWTVISTEVETMLRCLELEAHVALAERRFELASDVIARGCGTAERCGFGLFVMRFAALRQSGVIIDIPGQGRPTARETSYTPATLGAVPTAARSATH